MALAPSPAEAAARVRKASQKTLPLLPPPSNKLTELTKEAPVTETELNRFNKELFEHVENEMHEETVKEVEGTPLAPFVGAAESATSALNTAEGAVSSVASAAEALPKLAEDLVKPSLWLRIGKIFAGALIVLFGLYLVARALGAPSASKTAGKVVGAVGTVRG